MLTTSQIKSFSHDVLLQRFATATENDFENIRQEIACRMQAEGNTDEGIIGDITTITEQIDAVDLDMTRQNAYLKKLSKQYNFLKKKLLKLMGDKTPTEATVS